VSDHEAFEVPSGLPNIVTLAIQLWGEPTSRKPGEVRFGTNGSKSVKPAPVNTWRDHESDEGGGYVKLYELKYGNQRGRIPRRPLHYNFTRSTRRCRKFH
jgi:hypothetical protein